MTLPFPCSQHTPLSKYTTFGIGGPARYFAISRSIAEMQQMVQCAVHHAIPFFILGKGSNTLFDDRGFDGLVILNKLDGLEVMEGGIFRAQSGYSFARLGKLSSRMGYSGLEFAAGIPATVGGAVYMNAGACGQEACAALVEVCYLTEQGELKRLSRSAVHFGYRTSSFQKLKGAIVEASFRLAPVQGTLQEQKELLNHRLKSQPYKEKSAGCAFRNPPGYSAGALIEECGLKAKRIGGACVSSLHANFIVNIKQASSCDVIALMQEIKERVFEEKGILLEEEIRLVGYGNTISQK